MSKQLENLLSDYITSKQAADILGVTRNHIDLLLARGKIKGVRIGILWMVHLPSLENYSKIKSPRGRPPKNKPKFQPGK